MFIEITSSERDNLLAFLTGKGRIQLTGDEAFEFTKIVSKIANAKEEIIQEVEAPIEE